MVCTSQEAVDKMQQKLEELQREIVEVTEPHQETEWQGKWSFFRRCWWSFHPFFDRFSRFWKAEDGVSRP